MTMTSKERMLCALHREKPDRLPATVHQWQEYHLHNYMDGMSDLEAFRACGLDAAITRMPLLDGAASAWGFDARDWRISIKEFPGPDHTVIRDYTFSTPDGELTMQTRCTDITVWTTQHLVKRDEDINLISRHMPLPRLDKTALERDRDALGDEGILRGFVPGFQGGPWQDAVELHGLERMVLAAYEKPDWVHRFLEILLERRLRYIQESLRESAYDLIETGGGAGSSTVISPKLFKEFLIPYDVRLHRAIHAAGLPVVYHTCGGMTALLDHIWRNECDASETLTPRDMGGDIDPTESALRQVKQALGSHVCLIGGVDQEHVLRAGSAEDIQKHVYSLFETYGAGGGYMICPSDHFFEVPREKLELYSRAARECRY